MPGYYKGLNGNDVRPNNSERALFYALGAQKGSVLCPYNDFVNGVMIGFMGGRAFIRMVMVFGSRLW